MKTADYFEVFRFTKFRKTIYKDRKHNLKIKII